LREWLAALSGSSESEAVISLPKFKLNCRLDLSSDLAGMGMASAFGSGADFSGMTGSRNLFISSVVHQAFIDVNEEGTEAAAATAVTVMRSAMIRPNILRIDHPFLFLIVERETNSILFLGRVSDPSQ
jgi:serine protease inhibitor